jgi:hypothetical protein
LYGGFRMPLHLSSPSRSYLPYRHAFIAAMVSDGFN